MADFNNTLRSMRKDAGLSQQELGDRLGISKSAVSMYERGERTPDLELLERIADFFDVDLTYMVGSEKKITKLTGTEADDEAADQGGALTLLSAEERAVIKAYRLASADTRAAARAVLGVK
ncbi:MAG: helix-turn-helix transcriptional regulator [Lachnospiraceae bacterium]|nr:helix-turn-helix transcriptional regulator [Lachnospiraceae bacterium]